MAALSVGVIGIGAFGSKVALRLLWNGFHTLQLYDVNDISTRQFTNDYGGMLTGSPKMMAQSCDVVITVLPSAAELREVCFGWESLAKGFSNGGIVINLGIVDALEIVAIARELKERGVTLIDAPAFGTPAQAKEGKLALFVGGEEEAFARVRPVLETLAHRRGGRAAGARCHRRLRPWRGASCDMRSAAVGSTLRARAGCHPAHG
jgi:3-hydroxyisobutyrate dehydrogenase-like beta-hydroxyacid dehydrogenase